MREHARVAGLSGVVAATVFAAGCTDLANPGAPRPTPRPVQQLAASGVWTTKAPMTTARDGGAAAALHGVLYAIGGNGANDYDIVHYLASLEAYNPIANTWTTKAPMPTARCGLAVGVVNGILYAVGGTDNRGTAFATVEAYDPATDTWTTKAPMPTPRYWLGVGVVNGVLYAVGGGNTAFLATVEAYDPATNTWTTKAPVPAERSALAVAVANGRLYAAAGANAYGPVATFEAYDPATNTWSTEASMLTARDGVAADVLGGTLYVIGGTDGNLRVLPTVEAY
jgi:N-acetylneuraminic acid mutarotase